MIAAVLTFFGIMFISISGWGSVTAWVIIGVIALIWFIRMVWIDDARAHINWVDYWSRAGKERRRHAEVDGYEEKPDRREVVERMRREAAERERHEKEAHDRMIAERDASERKNKNVMQMVLCERCGSGARQIHRLTYPSGGTYVEYQCPRCGERKLKKMA